MVSIYTITKHKIISLKIIFIILLFILPGLVIGDEVFANTMSIIPESSTIHSDQFYINITCTPSEDIKSFECEITFNPSIYSVISVSEGDFFSGYSTFFNNGTVDNNNGSIEDIYGLIVGSGTVHSPGIVVSILCSAVSDGTSTINLSRVGITNQTSYISVIGVNSSVTIDRSIPEISNTSLSCSDPKDTDPLFGWVNCSCMLTDSPNIDRVWVEITCPNASVIQKDLIQGVSQWYRNESSVFCNPGTYQVQFYIRDIFNNQNESGIDSIVIPANWDVNNDGGCDLLDFVSISNYYGANGASGWIREDVDNSGEIVVLDLIQISNYYGKTWK